MSKTNSLIMAARLKQLRKERKLSHVSLSTALNQQYGIDISRDSLMSYEVTDPNHNKPYKNEGMRVEYLRCLADFYGVSSDYLLGLTDDPSKKPAAADELGLSPVIIDEIKRYKEIAPWRLSGLNTFLEATLPTNLFNEIDILRHKIVSESDTKPSTIELENAELYSKFGKSRADALVMQQLEDKLISQYPDLKGRISVKLSSFNIKEIYDGIIHDFKRCLGDMTGYNNFLK